MTRIARYTPATVQVGLLLAVGMLVGQGGCVGQGKYTSDHATLAQQRLDGIKSATELDMAEQAFLAGDLKKAREKLARVLAMNPSSLRARVLMGRVQLEQGAVGDAAVTLSEAVGLDAGSVDAQYYLGVVLERLHRPGEALDRFRTAAELKPFDPQYAIAAGEAFVDLERVDEARVFLEERPVAQNSPGVRQLLGHIAMIESRPADAAERFREARLLAPDEHAIAEDLARAQLAAGQFTEAELTIARLRRIAGNAERRDLLHMQAVCQLELDRPAEARSLYRRLIHGDDGVGDAAAWLGLGRSAAVLGDDADLRRAASRLVSMNPGSHDGHVLWALLHHAEGDTDLARASAERAIALARASGRVTADLLALGAVTGAAAGQHDAAREILAEARQMSPDASVIDAAARGVARSAYANAPVD